MNERPLVAGEFANLTKHRVQVVAIVINRPAGQVGAVGNAANEAIAFWCAPSAGHVSSVQALWRYVTGESHPTRAASDLLG